MRVIIGLVVCLTIVMHVAPVGGRKIRRTCKPLRDFPDTISTCNKAAKADGRYPKGTVCTFDCNEGCIRLQGVRQRVCKVRGRTKWWTGGRGLVCECNPCESAPSPPDDSTSDCDPADPPYPAGHVCIFDCMVGYNKTSGGTKLCKNGIWRGDDIVCEDIDDCASVTCQNGGTCIDGVDSYTCDCVAGYDGDHCENDIDDCASVTCQNGGTCLDAVDNYTCDCAPGFFGDHCETAGCSGSYDPPEDRRMVIFCSGSGPPYLLGTLCIHWCKNADGFFRQSGDESRTCQEGGIWSGDDLVCVDHYEDLTVACLARTDPPENERGSVFCDNPGPLYKIGTACIHSCNETEGFFQKSGDESRTCHNGTWGGDDLVCADAATDPTVACAVRTDPPEEERGSMFCTNSGPPYPIDTICIHSCDSGEGLFPESGDELRTCLGGSWDGDDLVCAAHGPNSTVACSDRTDPPEAERGNIMFCDQSGPPYPIGTVCTRSCDEAAGYFLNSGDEMRTCQGGAWDGAPLVCAADCAARTDPPEAERGAIFCDKPGPPYPIGTVCAHSCNNLGGFFISSGDTQRTCQVGGIWDGADLVCYVPPDI